MKPKFFNRVKNAVQSFVDAKENNSLSNNPEDFLRYGRKNRPLLQQWSQVEMSDQDMYTGHSYAVINKRANRAAALGKKFLYTEASPAMMDVAKKSGKEVEHPYITLIKKSKEFSQRKFWHDISTYLDLEGVYYLMAVRATRTNRKGETEVGAVQRFSMLNPYNIRRIIRESDGTLGGYVETHNGMYREIPKELIIEIRLLNPFDNDKAYSMTDAAKESQFTMKQAGDYTRHSIMGNINAPGAITTEVQLEDHIFDNFVSRIKNHTKGEPLYGNGTGAVNWESMQIDLDKAALDKITDIHRSTLFAVGGVSDMLMGHQKSGTGREVSKTQRDEFTENAVMPQIEDIIDALNLDYRRWYDAEWEKNEYEILLDNPLESDREAELKDIEIRDDELALREKLVGLGYEYELANKYAHGDISLDELGEPTLEPEITDDEADQIVANQDTQNTDESQADQESSASQDVQNRIMANNKFVSKEQNKKTLEAARARHEKKIGQPEDTASNLIGTNDKENNQVASRDMPGLYDDLEIDLRAVTDDKYRGCIMMNTEKIPVTQYIKNGEKDLVQSTDQHDHTMGAVSEIEPHTTLLYGLLNNGNVWKDKVDQVLSGWSMNKVKIQEVSYFELPESYAVIALLEESDEILDANGRLRLLPNLNTFSEYHPHITLAYINKDTDVDMWVKKLGKIYNGQIVSTTSLNYGDMPDEDKNTKKKIELNSHSHSDIASTEIKLDVALNELDPSLKNEVILQESGLQRAVAQLESDVAQAVIEALRSGDIDEAKQLVAEAQEEEFVVQLALILAAYYTILFPIYAAQLFKLRLSSFGVQGTFAMTDEINLYIKESSRKAAESHISTILNDFSKAIDESTNEVLIDELEKVVMDHANRREPDYMRLLPDNPNQEDISKAIKAGKFNDHPAYALARSLTREGVGLGRIESKVRQTFSNMSETRAKTIARHESSRVFNMSQYQADLQFLTETSNLDNAYKRLRSRTGEPCAVCAFLIKKTTLNPIPFTQNFADLGQELSASYKKPNGKMAVLKIPVNYEAIKAGNVHVNCNCEYELVIKRDDGTVLNKFDPSQPRGDDGKWIDGFQTEPEDKLQDFENKIRSDSVESFYAEDEDGRKILLKKSDSRSVEFTAEEMATMRTYTGVTATHNHPSSNSFSKDDLIFGSRINAKEIRVVSGEFDYSFRPANGVWPSESEIDLEYEKIADDSLKDFVQLHKEGKLSADQLSILWSDKTMLNFAKRFGGDYTKDSVEYA